MELAVQGNQPGILFIITGAIILSGLALSVLGRRTPLPRVTLLLLFGLVIGPHGADLIPNLFLSHFELVANIALLMVGFLLGGKLTRDSLQECMGLAFWMSLVAALVTAMCVGAGLWLMGAPPTLAVVLGCIASATAPAAVLDVVQETGQGGRFRQLLLSIVALDDAWALILFGLGIAVASSLVGAGGDTSTLSHALRDIAGAVLLGVCLGVPAAWLTGRLVPGQPVLSEALGIVFLCGGLAQWLGVSFLLAAMTMGVMVANLARHHEYPFHEIEGIEGQVMVIFFVLAGASLELHVLRQVGVLGIAYVVLRACGKVLGAWLGARWAGADVQTRRWMGVALLPQAGVAIGMALVASALFPAQRQTLLTIVIGSTVLFELVGPVMTRIALRNAGGR